MKNLRATRPDRPGAPITWKRWYGGRMVHYRMVNRLRIPERVGCVSLDPRRLTRAEMADTVRKIKALTRE